jgi:hypothetical protein
MTYWYLGIKEVIEDLRQLAPRALIVLGGVYATLCPDHARSLGADLVVEGDNLEPLGRIVPVSLHPLPYRTALMGSVAAMKLTEGCPFHCTYCAVPLGDRSFTARPLQECLAEASNLACTGAEHVAFYDDALLFQPELILRPFLETVIREQLPLSFHTPNALHSRFLTPALADVMVRGGFRNFFLGFESVSSEWLGKTGAKTLSWEFAQAVHCLRAARAKSITAYIIVGHPDHDEQQVEFSMNFVHEQGVRVMLSEFAPVPGSPDAMRCRDWLDLDEPLLHNKTAFTIRRVGLEKIQRLKDLCRELNSRISGLMAPVAPRSLSCLIGCARSMSPCVECKNKMGFARRPSLRTLGFESLTASSVRLSS